ncbi:hypothetical protein L226DRAFT_608838 [Lentinus tigrinus ALCF2SS1-7]|uniref:Uncharacterized protein n=1 Tax=Lentinus tigrinus ALCF2SS1-6 TaxID=1328759 RepID=A0A5C2SPX5_9APHY|nr:hypothetical protein L227DRAFT_559535 [Lentinus tigrinus ALCF2SS1-6]RPD79837.1 hypothetical protein L226DRAFT_608838 [Lentinus tigrinus ALCF2SS1-7]
MTATRTRPHFPRSFSSGYNADDKYELVHGLQRTQSMPASYPSTRPWGQRKRAITGPIKPAPKPPLTRAHSERASTTPSSAALEGRSAHHRCGGGVAMRRDGFGVGGPHGHQRPGLRRSPPAVHRFEWRSGGLVICPPAGPSLSDVMEDENSDASDDDEVEEEEEEYTFLPPGLSSPVPRDRETGLLRTSSIDITLPSRFPMNVMEDENSDASDEEEEPNPYARYTFLPPGLSSPVSRNRETGPLRTPSVDITLPSSSPMTRRTSSLLSATAIRPSLSRMGLHIHDHRLDHGPGGNADEDAFLRTPGPLLTPTPRGYSGLTMDTMGAPTLSRFNSFSSRRL